MLKRKLHNKGVEKEIASESINSEKSALNIRHRGSGRDDEKTPGRQRDQPPRDPHNRLYQHKSVPPGHGNNPDLLKYYLAQNFASPANLAREANVSRAAVSAVIHGRTRSERIERMISKSCGRTLQELFPAWYTEKK